MHKKEEEHYSNSCVRDLVLVVQLRIYRERERERERKKQGRMVGPSRSQFVLFGSSIVQFSFGNGGWGAVLAEVYARKADIVMRGYSGWNSRRALQVLDQVFPKDAAVQPSLVIVYFGGNDAVSPHPSGVGPHVPLPEYIENMKKIAIHIKSLSTKTRLIFLSAPPVNEAQIIKHYGNRFDKVNRKNELCGIYSEACVELCKELDVKVIDLWNEIQKQSDWLTTCFTDGIHFTSEGSKIVVKAILKTLKEADWKPHLHWKSLSTEFAEDSPCYPLGPDGKTTLNVSDFNFHWETNWD